MVVLPSHRMVALRSLGWKHHQGIHRLHYEFFILSFHIVRVIKIFALLKTKLLKFHLKIVNFRTEGGLLQHRHKDAHTVANLQTHVHRIIKK